MSKAAARAETVVEEAEARRGGPAGAARLEAARPQAATPPEPESRTLVAAGALPAFAVRQFRCRRRRRLGVGQLQQCLAGDPDFVGGPAEFVELGGQLRDLFPHHLGLRGDLPSPFLQPRQYRAEGQFPARHAVRQVGVIAPVSRRSITAVIAQ